ncbi:MAG TPA: SRPBCC family protein [Hyphomicrobiaceae bacterium]|nr:SRPBCC family protein [Hyphomicrobiaceae bacterium]
MTATARAKPSAEREVIITRLFDAPRELVWKAWTEPRHMAAWWGPKVMTNPDCKMDVRPGGAWRIVMRAPDGTEYPVKGVYREIVAPERIVSTVDCSEHPDAWHDLVDPERDKSKRRPPLDLLWTITFEEQGRKTKLTIHTLFGTPALRDAMVKMDMDRGWSESLDKLADLLRRLASTSKS